MKHSDLDYTLLQTWVTCNKATLEKEDIQMETFDLAQFWMSVSLLFKLPWQVDDQHDIALWKNFRSYSTRSGSDLIQLFHCPLFNLCKCHASVRIITGPKYISMYKRGEHNGMSHDTTQNTSIIIIIKMMKININI